MYTKNTYFRLTIWLTSSPVMNLIYIYIYIYILKILIVD